MNLNNSELIHFLSLSDKPESNPVPLFHLYIRLKGQNFKLEKSLDKVTKGSLTRDTSEYQLAIGLVSDITRLLVFSESKSSLHY